MSKFITVTGRKTGKEIFVNADNVLYICDNDDGYGSTIVFIGNFENLEVIETPKRLKERL